MTRPVNLDQSAERISRQLEQLATHSAPGLGVTRRALTDEYMTALGYLSSIAAEVGLQVHYDAVGNFYASNVARGQASIALGSHIDSVPNGGRFDGTAGVLCAFEVARLMPHLPLTVVSFIGEEGSRFPGGLLGSRCLAGEVTRESLAELRDEAGISFLDAASQRGFDAAHVADCAQEMRAWTQYHEIHIEQGRVLQDETIEIGLVTGIVGMIQGSLTITGRADHAGATPMHLRSDAGLTAAQVTVYLEQLVQSSGTNAVATIGQIVLHPGARNVIPGQAVIGLDIRSPDHRQIDEILKTTVDFAEAQAQQRGQTVAYHEDLRSLPVAMSPHIVDGLEQAAARLHITARRMVSGAGHDAMLVAPQVPAAMLFVPCRDGISHSPDEFAEPGHLAQAVAVLVHYLTAQDVPASVPSLEVPQ